MRSITEDRLIKLREEFRSRFGVSAELIYVGSRIWKELNPVGYPAWAIETTLVLERKQLPPQAIVLVKPPEVRKKAA